METSSNTRSDTTDAKTYRLKHWGNSWSTLLGFFFFPQLTRVLLIRQVIDGWFNGLLTDGVSWELDAPSVSVQTSGQKSSEQRWKGVWRRHHGGSEALYRQGLCVGGCVCVRGTGGSAFPNPNQKLVILFIFAFLGQSVMERSEDDSSPLVSSFCSSANALPSTPRSAIRPLSATYRGSSSDYQVTQKLRATIFTALLQ